MEGSCCAPSPPQKTRYRAPGLAGLAACVHPAVNHAPIPRALLCAEPARSRPYHPRTHPHHPPTPAQAEKLRAKAQRPEAARSSQQLARYLYYLGRIRAAQLQYTEARDCLAQASRKVGFRARRGEAREPRPSPHHTHTPQRARTHTRRARHAQHTFARPPRPARPPQAPSRALGFRVEVAKWLALVRLLLGEVPERRELTAPELRSALAPYAELARAVRAGDLADFR